VDARLAVAAGCLKPLIKGQQLLQLLLL